MPVNILLNEPENKSESDQLDKSYQLSLETLLLKEIFDEEVNDNEIVDSRFMSYLRFYISDIVRADTSRYYESEPGVIKINNCCFFRVSICGNIVSIWESNKYFR